MEQKSIRIFFALLRSAVFGVKLTKEELDIYSSVKWQELLGLAVKHDMQHLLAYGLKQNDLLTKENECLEQHIFTAAFRYESLQYEYDNLCSALEKAEIPFIPLKGSVIRKYYPEPWMRTSCDIDIYMHKDDCKKAAAILSAEYGYTFKGEGPHDLSLYSTGGMHIELHYIFVEDGRANKASEVLKNVWSEAVICKDSKYQHEMTDQMFYFYHIAHMAKHFEIGGCGVRPFVDLWILDHMETADINKRNELLGKGMLIKFANEAQKLSRVWFAEEEHSLVSCRMEQYILTGGVYGNMENRVLIQQHKKGGKLRYILGRIFIPYKVIKFQYPILKKHRWLTPFMQIRRWFRLAFDGRLKRAARELKHSNEVSCTEASETQKFLYDIGLSED